MRHILLGAVLLCPALTALAESVPVIDNPRVAPRINDVHFEEAWRAGADDSGEFIFGVIREAVSDAGGNIYLLDSQQQQVFRFSPEGEYLGLVSRKGEGPGEINMVVNLVAPGGGRIAMTKYFPPKIVMVDTLGTPLPSLDFKVSPTDGKETRFASISGLAFMGEHLVAMGSVSHADGVRQDNTIFLARFDSGGQEIHRYAQWPSGYDFSQPIKVDEVARYHPLADWDMDHQGRVYHQVEREAYLIQVVDPEGQPLFRIRREWPVHRRTGEEKEKAKNNFRFGGNAGLPDISYEMADTDPAIHGLYVMGDELWVTSTEQRRLLPEGVARAVSVFDLEGRLVEDRHFHVPREPQEDRLLYLADGRVVRVKAFYSAHAAANVSNTVQVGEKRLTGEEHDQEAELEVIVYRPVSP
jgi:hypothetical protein